MIEIEPRVAGLQRSALSSFFDTPLTGCGTLRSIEFQFLRFGPGNGGVEGYMACLLYESGFVLHPEPHLPVDEHWAASDPAFTNLRVTEIAPTTFETAQLDVTRKSVSAAANFTAHDGRSFAVIGRHVRRKPARPIFVPADPQHNVPATWRFFSCDSMWAMPRRNARVSVEIEGDRVGLLPLYVPERFATHWAARAGGGVIMAGCNGTGSGIGQTRVENDDGWFEVRGGRLDDERGEFTIESNLGVVGRGTFKKESADGAETTIRLSELSQGLDSSELSVERRVLEQLRIRRRQGEQWAWEGRMTNGPDGWTRDGQWSV